MTIVQMNDEAGQKYRSFLETYRNKFHKEPGPVERTEAFFCAISKDNWNIPMWCKCH